MEKIVIGTQDALVVVDMTGAFAEESGSLYVKGLPGEVTMARLIAHIETLLEKPFERVIPTQDMHPDNHIEHTIYGKHCVMGTRECGVIPVLDEKFRKHPKVFYYLHKGHDSRLIGYSVSFSQDFALFVEDMRRNGIKRIFFVGLAYTHCVGESAIDVARQLFEVYVIRDATLSIPKPYGDVEVMDKKLALYGVKIITMADIA